MKIWKRIVSILASTCLVMGMLSTESYAAEGSGATGVVVFGGTEHNSHPVCGAAHTDIGDHTGACEDVTWTEWNGTDAIPYDTDTNTAYVYLAGDVTRDDALVVNADYTLYLCLNGNSITESDTGEVIFVNNGARFILCDCKGGGTITHVSDVTGTGVKVGAGSDADFIMYGGTISGNHVGTSGWGEDGAGVRAQSSTVTMYGGAISDNHVDVASNYGGGGVCALSRGKFIMYGGEISNNTSADSGGGVSAWGGSAAIYGGTISGNTAAQDGGGICLNSNLPISGNSVIENNQAANGGGVYFYGLYSDYTLTISDSAKITGNTATGDGASNGGGVFCANKGSLMMNGGSITDNTATGMGGGVYFNNNAGSEFGISGGADISGNKKDSADNNVYLPTNKYITIVGKMTGSKKIGVTTETTPDASAYVCIAQGSKDYADPEKFQYENNTIPVSVVISRNTAKLIVCVHNWNTIWSTDSSNHWHECAICKGEKDTAAHVYDQEITAEGYKVSEATCTTKAVYYKSCICGAKGTETFESGEKDTDNHTGVLSDWKSDGSDHWKEYSCCGAHAETAAHTPGPAATEEAPQTCMECGYEIAPALAHTHAWGAWISNGDGTHTRICSKDSSHTETNRCSGGTATCQNKAVCAACNAAYGELGSHDPADTWSKDANRHWHACQTANCTEKIDFAAHTPGPAATEEAPQTCTVCEYEIAPAFAHTHTWGAWISNGDGTHTRTCSKDNSHTETNSCSGGTATCQSPAACTTCAHTYGNKDMSNHTGGTEVRGRVRATTSAAGYTGDTYCKGCNTKIKDGKTIPKKDNGSNKDGNSGSGDNSDTEDGNSSTEEPPKSLATGNTAPAYVLYTVQKGDNLWTLAKKYGCTISEIVAANSDLIKNPSLIYPGWQFKIPQNGTTGVDNTSDAILTDNKKTGIYIVKRGDTLWALAKKYGCTVTEIVALNRELIADPDLIFIGWELKIPQN